MLEEIDGVIGLFGKASIALPALGIIALIIVGIFILRQTRSAYPLMARLWRIFNRNDNGNDLIINEFLDGQTSLMKLRFTTGVQARTQSLAHKLIDWTRQHNENIDAVAACGAHFDLESVMLNKEDKLPKTWNSFVHFIVAYVLLMLVILFAAVATLNRAVLQFRESGVFFISSAEYAKPLWSKYGLSEKQCSKIDALPDSGFRKNDAKIVCEIFKDENFPSFLREAVMLQRGISGIFTLVFAWLFWEAFRWFLSGVRAREMLKRLRANADGVEQIWVSP